MRIGFTIAALLLVSPAHADPTTDKLGIGDALDLVSGAFSGKRLEAILSNGSYATRYFGVRATDAIGPFGFELTSDVLDSGGFSPIAQRGIVDGPAALVQRDTIARIEHSSGGSTERAFGHWFEESAEAGTQHQKADVASSTYGGSWNLDREQGRLESEVFGGEQRFHQDRARVSEDRTSAQNAGQQTSPAQSIGANLKMTSRALGNRGHVIVAGGNALRVNGLSSEVITRRCRQAARWSRARPAANSSTSLRSSRTPRTRRARSTSRQAYGPTAGKIAMAYEM